jgi:hypothetical protein
MLQNLRAGFCLTLFSIFHLLSSIWHMVKTQDQQQAQGSKYKAQYRQTKKKSSRIELTHKTSIKICKNQPSSFK